MAQNLLVNEFVDAGSKLATEFNDFKPIDVAFWVQFVDSEESDLYLACDGIDTSNYDASFGEAFEIARRHSWLDPFRVNVINSNNPMAVDAIRLRDQHSGKLPIRFYGPTLGGKAVEEAYIYREDFKVKA